MMLTWCNWITNVTNICGFAFAVVDLLRFALVAMHDRVIVILYIFCSLFSCSVGNWKNCIQILFRLERRFQSNSKRECR